MIMANTETKLQILDMTILMALVFVGCMAGKAVMIRTAGSILGFNITAIAVLVVGELIWAKVRSILRQRWSEQDEKRDACDFHV